MTTSAIQRTVLRAPSRPAPRGFGSRVLTTLAFFGLVAAGWLAPGPGQVAWAQTMTECHPAASKGDDGPVDFGAYCWIDFSSLNPAQAETFGQDFQVNLPGGVATLTFTLDVNNNQDIRSATVPSWGGAAFGNFAFNGIPGEPVLYQDDNNGQTTIFTLTDVTLNANGTSDLPFVFVAADGESTNSGESLEFTTSGDPWELVASPGLGQGYATPTLSYSNGNRTVLESGAGSGNTVGYVFTTDNSPGTVSSTLVGSGLQGIIFGLKYYTIGLSVTKSHIGDFIAGGTGTYTIDVANTVVTPTINPPSDPQPVRVVDTLPAGLTYASASGTGWSCSNVGQVVTCDTTSLQDLTYTRTFPSISINVNVDSDAPATLTNNVEVSDPTTSTLVFNVCEIANNGICPNSATSSTGDPTNILHPDLSTSTKTVADLNGGDADPGDVLRYTITMTESGGQAASGVSVTDDIPANVSGFTVVSTPAGSADASTPTGGANNTGYLNVTGISVPANGSVTVVFDVTIPGTATPGEDIDNTATVTNPNGPDATPAAPTVEVSVSQVPSSGNKILYVYDNQELTRIPQTANTTTAVQINDDDDFADWQMTPAVPAGRTLVLSAQDVVARLVVEATGSSQGNNRPTEVQLRTSSGVVIGTDTISLDYGPQAYDFILTVPQTTLLAGDYLVMRVINHESQGNNRRIAVHQMTAGDGRSTLSFDTPTVINVDSVAVYSAAHPAVTTQVRYVHGETVYVRAVISDPFGAYDVSGADIVITDPDGAVQVAATAMTAIPAAQTASSKTFEYAYTVPAGAKLGVWNASVTGKEGSEGTVTHTGNIGFTVEGQVTLDKTWVNATAGDAVDLTIAGGSSASAGTSTAPATTTAAIATSPAAATITLAEAFTTGSASNYTVALACVKDSDASAVAVAGNGLSRTIVMPDDSSVTCTYSNTTTVPLTIVKSATTYSDPLNGTTNPKAIPGALVTYQLTVIAPAQTQADTDSVVITDSIPANTDLFVNDLPDQAGTSPVAFTASGGTLTLAFNNLADLGDDVAFSDDGGTTWTYGPTPDANGVDAAVTDIRLHPKGTLAPGDNFWLVFRVRVE